MRPITLITGASAGIGAELARVFAEHGHELALVARREHRLVELADEIARAGRPRPHVLRIDLEQSGAVTLLAAELIARDLEPANVVNNAGFGLVGQATRLDRSEQLAMIDLNVRALTELTHIYWPRMLKNRRGGVLNVASTAAFQPGPLMAVYYASKAFVLSFSEALWREAQGTGVHVSCLCPGPTVSKFRERAGTGKTKLSRVGAPMSSASVARMGYRAFQKNQRVMITGFRNRMLDFDGVNRLIGTADMLALGQRYETETSDKQ